MSRDMTAVTVLMYHAVGDGCRGADPHYAVTRTTFRRHLELARAVGRRVTSVAQLLNTRRDVAAIAFTFDDGHESNAAAAEDILQAGGSGDLFVNPGLVGQRDFLDWAALRRLADFGISIQSHGHSHRYFDELTASEIEEELRTSKLAIEDRVGREVFVFAPPGGRITAQVAAIARAVGYRAICTSATGLWRDDTSPWAIPRLAVLASTSDSQLKRWIVQDRWELTRMAIRHNGLAGAKQLLGNHRYERLRSLLLGSRSSTGSAS